MRPDKNMEINGYTDLSTYLRGPLHKRVLGNVERKAIITPNGHFVAHTGDKQAWKRLNRVRISHHHLALSSGVKSSASGRSVCGGKTSAGKSTATHTWSRDDFLLVDPNSYSCRNWRRWIRRTFGSHLSYVLFEACNERIAANTQ